MQRVKYEIKVLICNNLKKKNIYLLPTFKILMLNALHFFFFLEGLNVSTVGMPGSQVPIIVKLYIVVEIFS